MKSQNKEDSKALKLTERHFKWEFDGVGKKLTEKEMLFVKEYFKKLKGTLPFKGKREK